MDKLRAYIEERCEFIRGNIDNDQLPNEQQLHNFVTIAVKRLKELSTGAPEQVKEELEKPWAPFWDWASNSPCDNGLDASQVLSILSGILEQLKKSAEKKVETADSAEAAPKARGMRRIKEQQGPSKSVAELLRIGPVVEEAERAANARAIGGNKGKNAQVAYTTLRILEEGGYRSPEAGNWIDLQSGIQAAIDGTEYFASGSWQPARLPKRDGPCTVIEVRCCTCLSAARELAGSQAGPAAGVLNFASARNPGGGFSTGASAQEESIARSSALYPCLTKYFDEFFVPSRRAESGAYTHDIIYSPQVPVICDDDGRLLESYYCADFLTCAAPNAGVLSKRHSAKEAEQIANDAIRERVARMLQLFAQNGVSDLVLGAWGCGVFGNSTESVAAIFKAALAGPFQNRFRCVVFAVLDRKMAQVFAQALDTTVAGDAAAFGDAASKNGKGKGRGYDDSKSGKGKRK